MFEMHFTMFKAALCVQSMQRGVLAACISVKVTVDFCCTVPFLISIATIAHSSLSLYFCFSASLSRSLTHTHSSAGKDTNMILSIALLLYTFSLSGSVSGLHLPSLTARTLQQPANKALQLPKQLPFRELY